jgi:AraC-like DNA-binding protein
MVLRGAAKFPIRDLPKEQFPAWRVEISETVQPHSVEQQVNGFESKIHVWNLGGLTLTKSLMPGSRYASVWTHIKQDSIDHFCLIVAPSNDTCNIDTPRGGYVGFRSHDKHFEGPANGSQVISLFIPRDLFSNTSGSLDLVETAIDDVGCGSIVADFLLTLVRRLPEIDRDQWPRIVAATRSLVAACLVPSRHLVGEEQPAMERAVMQRARSVIQREAHCPHFGPTQLCREIGVSRSKLYRLFKPFGGVSHFILRQRLFRVQAELSDPMNQHTICSIAERCGFRDPSGFTRAFRKAFGYSPSEARATAHSATLRQPQPAPDFQRSEGSRDLPWRHPALSPGLSCRSKGPGPSL